MPDNRLREIRESKNISGNKIAEQMGITPQHYYDLETGRRRLNEDHLKDLSKILNVSIDYILGLTGQSKPVEIIAAHRTDGLNEELDQAALDEIEFLKQYVIDKYRSRKGDKPDGKR